MRCRIDSALALLAAVALTALPAVPAMARALVATLPDGAGGLDDGDDHDEGLPYLQCVPYARAVSGIDIHGDALTWWSQAEGRYARGNRPRPGAVMSFAPHGAMRLGHVAAVSRVIDSRTVLLRHANWSPIDGRRGRIEDNVRAVDVSPDNDWSAVRVWYAPLGGLGTTAWPVNGFIYNRPPNKAERPPLLAAAARPAKPAPSRIGADFLDGIVPEVGSVTPRKGARAVLATATPAAARKPGSGSYANDPIGRIIASRMR